MKKYFAGVDIGTTGVKTIIVDENGEIGSLAYREYPCEYPNPGWVEQDVNLIWKKVCECTKDAVSKINEDKKFIKSMGLSSQRGTFIPVDEKLQPLMNSIVWSDARAYKELLAIKKQIGEVKYKQITGVPLSGLWSYAKIKWLINNKPDIFDRVFKILNGQEYFLYKFGSDDLQTDPSSLTLNGMLDIAHLDWSSELCHEIGLPIDKLPPVNTPCREVGKISTQAAEETGFPEKMSIAVGGGDQQCAAIGSGIIREGMAEMTIGTAMVMVAHIENLKRDEERKVLMGGSAIPNKWDMEGTQFTAGAALKWWRDTFFNKEAKLANKNKKDIYDIIIEGAESSPTGSRGLLFFPFFQGQSTPNYEDRARGGLLGLSFIHRKEDISRAVLEGISFETNMIKRAMEDVLGKGFDIIRLSGGGSKSSFWNEIQSSIYSCPIEILKVSECTTLGAAILGATACNYFDDIEQAVDKMVHVEETISPDNTMENIYTELFEIYVQTFNALSKQNIYGNLSDFQDRFVV